MLQTSEVNSSSAIDTSDQSKNQINNANAPSWTTRNIGINGGQKSVSEESWSWVNATVDNGYAVVESSDVRLRLRVNNRDVTRNGGTYYLTTEWTVYPTGQIFRWDSLSNANGDFSIRHEFSIARSDGDSTVYLNSSQMRAGIHSTNAVADFAGAFLGYVDKNSSNTVSLSEVGDESWDDATYGATGFSFRIADSYVEQADFPLQTAYLLDFSSESMSNNYIDSVANGVQYIRFGAGDVTTGSRVTSAKGDLDGDGFNQGQGAYEVQASGNAITMRLAAGGDTCRFYPAIRIANYTYAEKPRYVLLYNADDTLLLPENYGYTMYHNKVDDELVLQLDTVLCDSSWLYISADRTLAVTMGDFQVLPGDAKDTLVWITESEHENMGFNIYRRVAPQFLDTLSKSAAVAPHDSLLSKGAVLFKEGKIGWADTLWGPAINKRMVPGAKAGINYGRKTYRYIDFAVYNNVLYEYYIEAVDNQNNRELFGPVAGYPHKILPAQFMLHAAFPNPFKKVANIKFALPVKTRVNLSIYNLQGRRIRQLIKSGEKWDPSFYSTIWDGLDDRGMPVANGPYVYRLVCEDRYAKARVLMRVR
jgi:hypothetical protein